MAGLAPVVSFLWALACLFCCAVNATYNIGVGIADVTGTAAEVGMMGYAMINQRAGGIHLRQRARAFVIEDTPGHRIVYVSADICMVFQEVRTHVLQKLQATFGTQLYTEDNVMLHGTHTHAGPAGFAYYILYDLTSFGFIEDNFNVIVNGIYNAIVMAHNNMRPARIFVNTGTLLNSNINRSPSAYLLNPEEERAQYEYNVDKIMTVWKIVDTSGHDMAAIAWFSVHGTSMNNTNQLISGDNKGYASYAFERYMNGNDTLPGLGPFVAAFPQSNEGDVSPNTLGTFCPNGTPCDFVHSTCDGKNELCHGRGPGATDFESTEIIGTNQFRMALELYQSATIEITGPISWAHMWVNMENTTVDARWTHSGQIETTCLAALGDGFAAGTTDGPGAFDFRQGSNSTSDNPFWNFIVNFIEHPSEEQKQCQTPKPILLNTGAIHFPAPWTAGILPLQMFRIGQFFLTAVPGEFTTMSGRRLRDTISQSIQDNNVPDANNTYVVIAGLANSYSHYIATWEEYQQQRYEGASTLYGPNTLAAYQMYYYNLTSYLVNNLTPPHGPNPPNLTQTWTLLPPWLFDEPPLGKHFGDVEQDVNSSYTVGQVVVASFWGANPRNNLRTNSSFFNVERMNEQGQWEVYACDGDWETKFYWKRQGAQSSLITLEWDVPTWTPPGTYRLHYYGDAKSVTQQITPIEGVSSPFQIVA